MIHGHKAILSPLSSLLSPLYKALSSIQSVPLSSIPEPVSLLSHCVSMGRVPDACGYGRLVSLTISSHKSVVAERPLSASSLVGILHIALVFRNEGRHDRVVGLIHGGLDVLWALADGINGLVDGE